MRNLKKILALVLALVMSLSLVTMANAADFSDAADIDYTEAVDVMVAIGVLEGADGKFNPKDILTREQAAKIVTYMLLGKAAADKLVTEDAPFTDVAATRWSAGVIAYCAEKGILAGNGDGTYNPTGKLTGHAFAKMLLVALGYDAKAEGYVGTGNTWSINVAADAVAAGIDVEDVALDLEVTREQAAQMALQTLTANLVKYESLGTEITLSDGTTVVIGATPAETYDNTLSLPNILGDADAFAQFSEKYFKKLDKVTGTPDSFGRPAYTWYYGDVQNSTTKIGQYADTADYTVVVTGSKNDSLAEILDANELELNATDDPYFVGSYATNGSVTELEDTDATAPTDVNTAIDTELAVGSVVELFLNSTGKVNAVVTYKYSVSNVAKVAKAADDADYDYLVTLEDVDGTGDRSYKDTKIAGFDADKFAKDTKVLVVKKGNTDILSIAAVKAVEGKLTSYNTSADTIKVDGTSYPYAYSFNPAGLNNDDTYEFYLDPNGYVMGCTTVAEVAAELQYLYVSDVEFHDAVDTLKDKSDAAALAEVTFMDGTEKVVNLWIKKAADAVTDDLGTSQDIAKGDWYFKAPDGKVYEFAAADDSDPANGDEYVIADAEALFADGFYAFELKDDMYVLKSNLSNDDLTGTDVLGSDDTTLTVEEGKAAVVITGTGVAGTMTANSKTVLSVIYDGKVTTYEGIKNFDDTTFEIDVDTNGVSTNEECVGILVVADADTGVLTNIYVIGADVAATDVIWGYAVEATDVVGSDEYWNVYVDGVAKDYVNGASLTDAGLYSITFEDGEIAGKTTSGVIYGTVDLVDDSYFTVSSGTYYFDEDCKIYNISGDFTGEETTIAKGDVVAIGTYNDSGVYYADVIYVIDAPAVMVAVGANNAEADADTTTEYVQTGVNVTVSGDYTTGDYLWISFDGGDNWVKADASTIATNAAADPVVGDVDYTTVGGTTDYADFAGIVLNIDFSSMDDVTP